MLDSRGHTLASERQLSRERGGEHSTHACGTTAVASVAAIGLTPVMVPSAACQFAGLRPADACPAAAELPSDVAAKYPRVALLVDELRIVQHARLHRSVVYVMGRTYARLSKHTPLHLLPKRYLLELPFKARPESPAATVS